jgi:hypothetical protein
VIRRFILQSIFYGLPLFNNSCLVSLLKQRESTSFYLFIDTFFAEMTTELTCGCYVYRLLNASYPRSIPYRKIHLWLKGRTLIKLESAGPTLSKETCQNTIKLSYYITENNQMMLKNLQSIAKRRYIKISIKHTLYSLHRT